MNDGAGDTDGTTDELLRRARSGDADAWTAIYAAYAPRVRGLAAMRLGRTLHDLVDCDDVVQQAMAIAFARLITPRDVSLMTKELVRFPK